MPYENIGPAPKRIAVIGAGISGMGAAHMLADSHSVVLFESEKRLGGHARTKVAGKNGDQPVDTGFIVFNYANYPHMADLFAKLDVPVIKSNMSFGASIDGGRLEYAFSDFGTIFAQKSNLARPAYWRMLRDVYRFNARAFELSRTDDMTIAGLLDVLGSGEWFKKYYLTPLSGAIWSTPVDKILDFPAKAMIDFFENHALLHHTGQHQWYTVDGGSIEYVRRLGQAMERQGVDMRLGAGVEAVRRTEIGVEIKVWGAQWECFDEVVFATHSDDSLSMLSDPSEQERKHLGAVKYQPNEIILHADDNVMPRRKKCWSSWNYTEDAGKQTDKIDLTYWMNCLQPIPKDDPMFVTLNSTRSIREELIYDQTTLRHPVYDLAALQAQKDIAAMNGTNKTWFCGAWMKNGFHEDGLSSAIDVVSRMADDASAVMAAQ
jgi:predicted NAD/FAD-binding protein